MAKNSSFSIHGPRVLAVLSPLFQAARNSFTRNPLKSASLLCVCLFLSPSGTGQNPPSAVLQSSALIQRQSETTQLPCTPNPACYTGQLSAVGSDGLTHYYEVYVPSGLLSLPPMMIYLPPLAAGKTAGWDLPPGLPANDGSVSNRSHLESFAEEQKVIILWVSPTCRDASAYPTLACASSSTSLNWYFNIDYFDNSMNPPAQDAAFIHSLITTAKGTWGVDPSRIAMLGYSTGGFMANRYGLDQPGDLMGIAIFNGQLWAQPSRECTDTSCPIVTPAAQPTAIYLSGGTADTTIPMVGGTYSGWRGSTTPLSHPKQTFPSEDTTFGYWMNSSCPDGTVTSSDGTTRNTNIIVTPIASITGDGTVATVTCTLTCGANPTGVYAIGGNGIFDTPSGGTITASTDSGSNFTFPSSVIGTGAGGNLYLTSKLVAGCTGNREIKYVTDVGGKHEAPSLTLITDSWQFLAQFPLSASEP
jgi:hypothetical protein